MATDLDVTVKAPIGLRPLIVRFRDNLTDYCSAGYNETQLRREFVDPLFELLGWDVANRLGWSEAYKQVIHEDRIQIAGRSKAPDYSFRIGPQRKFFLETKRPSVRVQTDGASAYQLRRYAWNAKLPLSILTNFETLTVYDCRIKPQSTDKASTARIKTFQYSEFEERWTELWSLFSFEAIAKGAFDKFASERRRGTQEVDDDFLGEIERWRELLARAFIRRNANLSSYELNDAVQKTIDRIVFLRIAEDRGIEPRDHLLNLSKKSGIYSSLAAYFRRADGKYNSGLFHFDATDGSAETVDQYTLALSLEDKPLRDIITSVYPPKSPYEFSYIPADILGQVYERFLGKTITVKGHSIEIDEKPDVKKAGGVYYTPTYVVRYIVQKTVREALESRTVNSVAGAGKAGRVLRVLDPACGSGSFLIEAYQTLLDWHLEQYTSRETAAHARGKSPKIYRGPGNAWRLTIAERKRILITHIFGVDIDPQAVEVTKLSLLLKVLEGESKDVIASQIDFFKNERALPDLGFNIRCGNSLIDPDFYGLFDVDSLTEEQQHKVNVFPWTECFLRAFQDGGFDVVIGNPPYGGTLMPQEKSYLQSAYKHQSYQLDTYLLFLERSIDLLLKKSGCFGMIIPNPWLTNLLQGSVRKYVFDNTTVQEIVHFTFPVFARAKATVDTEIVVLKKGYRKSNTVVAKVVERVGADGEFEADSLRTIQHDQGLWIASGGLPVNIFAEDAERRLAAKLNKAGQPLRTHFYTSVGMKPYQVGKGTPKQTRSDVNNRVFDATRKITPLYRQYLRGADINRFIVSPVESRFIKFGEWLAEPRPTARFNAPKKILMRQTGDSLIAALDSDKFICMNNMHVLAPKSEAIDLYYILGLVNSKLMNWFYQTMNPEVGEGLAEVKKSYIELLPVPSTPNALQTTISDAARAIERNVAKLRVARDEASKRLYMQTLTTRVQQLNEAVYSLFGLSKREREIVERTQQRHMVH